MPSFSGKNAYDHVARQVSFGTREPNSAGARKAVDYFVEYLSQYADSVTLQKFTRTGYENQDLHLTNVIASFNENAPTRILLCAHWDTRPRADMDADPSRQDEPILGANDGGSGVGVLLELARILGTNPPSVGVDIVLFDGEDYGNSDIDDLYHYFLGAEYFAENLPKGYRPAFGILLDMVGDPDAVFEREQKSEVFAPQVLNLVWNAAQHLEIDRFKNRIGREISDDHVRLNEIAHIPTIDIIDADLVGHDPNDPRRQYWHTHKDTMDNISADALGDVGTVLTYLVYKVIPDRLQQPA
jgi:hypothetical protein